LFHVLQPGGQGSREGKSKKQFFLEKKNQETLVIVACAAGQNRDSDVKVFCFFSSEKKSFLHCISASRCKL
jgi:hypothetical protein